MTTECIFCGAPLDEVEEGFWNEDGERACLDCYDILGLGESPVSSEECGYCGSGTDPNVICQSCLESMEEGDA